LVCARNDGSEDNEGNVGREGSAEREEEREGDLRMGLFSSMGVSVGGGVGGGEKVVDGGLLKKGKESFLDFFGGATSSKLAFNFVGAVFFLENFK